MPSKTQEIKARQDAIKAWISMRLLIDSLQLELVTNLERDDTMDYQEMLVYRHPNINPDIIYIDKEFLICLKHQKRSKREGYNSQLFLEFEKEYKHSKQCFPGFGETIIK